MAEVRKRCRVFCTNNNKLGHIRPRGKELVRRWLSRGAEKEGTGGRVLTRRWVCVFSVV